MGTWKSEARGGEVTGAATKSSSPESSRTAAGRNLPPGVSWKPIRIRTISPGRRVMDQLFVNRVVGSVRRIELPPARCAPCGVVFGDAPLEYDLDLCPRRNLRCDLRRHGNLAVWLAFASEVSRLHYSFLTCLIISRVRTARRARAPSWLPRPVSEWPVIRPEPVNREKQRSPFQTSTVGVSCVGERSPANFGCNTLLAV